MIKALTLSFYAGLIEILAGILNLGSLINFISVPVISAFTSAVSIQVATSQVKGLLGLKVNIKPRCNFFYVFLASFDINKKFYGLCLWNAGGPLIKSFR